MTNTKNIKIFQIVSKEKETFTGSVANAIIRARAIQADQSTFGVQILDHGNVVWDSEVIDAEGDRLWNAIAETNGMTNTKNINVGDLVHFGRANGEQTLGEIVKKNQKTCKVRQKGIRGTQKSHPVGTIWKVPYSMVTPVLSNTADTSSAVCANQHGNLS